MYIHTYDLVALHLVAFFARLRIGVVGGYYLLSDKAKCVFGKRGTRKERILKLLKKENPNTEENRALKIEF